MGGGVSLSSPFGIVICVSRDLSFYMFWLFLFDVFFSLFAFSPLSLLCPFPFFLFFVSFAASFSHSLSLPPSPLSYLISWPFLRLLCSLFFLRLFLSSFFSSFPSSSSSFSFPFWFHLLPSPLAPLPRLSLPFLLLLPFLLHPLPSSLFLFRLCFFPSTLFFPSCWLFFLLVCPRCLFGGFLFFLFAFLAFGLRLFLSLRFWVVLVLLCVSRVGVFSPGVLFSCLYLCLLSSAPSRAFASASSIFFLAFPYLPSSVPLLSVSSSTWFLPVTSTAVPLSPAPAPSSSASLYFAPPSVPQPSSLLLCWWGGGGGLATAWRLHYLDNRRWSLLPIRGFLHGFCSLFSVPPAVASGSSSLHPAAPLLAPPSSSLSGFVALG